jgi:hypothetical protein
MARRKKTKTRRFGSYPLSGLVRCGHCNANMTARTQINRQGKNGNRTYRQVFCGTYNRGGKSRCSFNAVDADQLLRLTVEKLKWVVCDPGFQKTLLQEANREIPEIDNSDKHRLSALKTELADLKKQIDKAAAKLIDEENADLVPVLRDQLRKRQQASDDVAAQIKALEDANAAPPTDLKAEADEFLAFDERLEEADHQELEDALLNLLDYVELFFDRSTTATGRTRSRFAHGFIYLRPGWIADLICNYIRVTNEPRCGTHPSGRESISSARPGGTGPANGPR